MNPDRQKQSAVLELVAMLRLSFENQVRNLQQIQDQRAVVTSLETQINLLLTELYEKKRRDRRLIEQLKGQIDGQRCELHAAQRRQDQAEANLTKQFHETKQWRYRYEIVNEERRGLEKRLSQRVTQDCSHAPPTFAGPSTDECPTCGAAFPVFTHEGYECLYCQTEFRMEL